MEMLKELYINWMENPNKPIRIVAFGSSNTEQHWHSMGCFNWVSWLTASLRSKFGKHISVINQGIGGETVKDLLKRFDRDVTYYKPDVVIITIGGNDAKSYEPEDYEVNLRKLVDKVKEIGALPVLQTYYCPLYKKMSKKFQQFPIFVEINRKIASDVKIPLIDQYKFFEPFYKADPKNYKRIMLDALHVNPIGNAIMGIIICRYFHLQDPPFLKYKKEIKINLKLMEKYSKLTKVL